MSYPKSLVEFEHGFLHEDCRTYLKVYTGLKGQHAFDVAREKFSLKR